MKNGESNKINTKILVQVSILVAISIVLTRLVYIMILPTLRLEFGQIPLIICGFLFGPVIGGLSGLVADLVGFVINPQGPYHPGFTLSSIMWGVISGLFVIYFKNKKDTKKLFTPIRITITVVVATIFILLGLNTFWLSRLFSKGFIAMIPGRIILVLISIPIQSYIITVLMKHIKHIIEQK